MKTLLILIRHGLTLWNAQKKYCGSTDIGISLKGKKQARRIKIGLKAEKVDTIYSSDRKRALQTARIIFGKAAIHKKTALREMNFGVFEGLTYHRIMQLYPEVYKKWLRNPFQAHIPNGEHLKEARKRVSKAIKSIVLANPGRTAAVVCHGGVIGVLMTCILKSNNFWRYIPDSASLTFIDFYGRKAKIRAFNSTAHLCKRQRSKNTWRETAEGLKNG